MRHPAHLALTLAALAAFGARADEVDATAIAPWTYSDGSPLTAVSYLWRSGCVRSGQYERPIEVSDSAAHTYKGLPDAICYLRLSAADTHGNESKLSDNEPVWDGIRNVIVPPSPTAAPTGIATFVLVPTPAPATVKFVLFGSNNLDQLTLPAADVKLNFPAGAKADWVRRDTALGPFVTTIPTLGIDNDGVNASSVTIKGPGIFHVDVDGGALTGLTATIGGVTKPFVPGATWSVSF